ncbi:MAG: hypothetical protein NTY48_06340 [Candidatus Diapherotrites archaeon]|nr:hypothetical protein [Candidatus Diapherotrites archaeon]
MGVLKMGIQAIKAIDYMSALKVGAVGGLIYGIIMGIGMLALGGLMAAIPGAALAGGALGIVGLVMAIIGGLIGGAIAGIIGAVIYNIIIVKLTGGLKIDLQ